jgi:predicted phosphodiesterase
MKEVRAKVETQEDPFIVKGNNVQWKYKRGEIVMSIEDLDSIFYEYSKHGLNMSQVQVQNKHGLDALQWQSFKRTFDLVKDSDVFSPYTLSLFTGKECCDMIAEKIAEKYNPRNMRAVIEYEDNKQKSKAQEKAIKEYESYFYKWNELSNALLEYVSAAKAVFVRVTKKAVGGNAVAFVTDLHGGAEHKATKNLPAYNYNVMEKRLAEVAKDINAQQPKELTLVLGGDFIESFTGMNHKKSWAGISKEAGHGIDAVLRTTDILKGFISQVHNIKEVLVVSGNHDRVTSSNDEDATGDAAKLIAKLLEVSLAGVIPVEWNEDIISRKIDGCGFHFLHGHTGLAKKPADLLNAYGYTGLYNLVLLGHLHSVIIKNDSLHHRIMNCASIFTGNSWSKKAGYSSTAGYTYVDVTGKLPNVALRTIH